MAKINYLNNRDMLKEIHKSKNSYCSYLIAEDGDYDMILPSLSKINKSSIAEAKENRAERLARAAWDKAVKIDPKVKLDSFKMDPEQFDKTEVVFRIMTMDHVPLEPGRKKTPKSQGMREAA